jgi:hypothetical protein
MFIRQIFKVASASTVIGFFCLAAMVAMPASVKATDIAWHLTSTLTDEGPPWKREGTAVFKTGENASLVANGTSDAPDKGVRSWKGQYVLRFEDGSTITTRVSGKTDIWTGASSGSGEFVNGAGRFEGITGTVAFVSHGSGEGADWVGSYSLPNK